jgi:hypothetical protein
VKKCWKHADGDVIGAVAGAGENDDNDANDDYDLCDAFSTVQIRTLKHVCSWGMHCDRK